jgi:DNA-binding LacI/PurR family transcriptional regulator
MRPPLPAPRATRKPLRTSRLALPRPACDFWARFVTIRPRDITGGLRGGPPALLQAHEHLDGDFAENDETALGAIKALVSKAGKSVQLVGFDGTPDGLNAVEAGTLYASVARQPKERGRIAVDNAAGAAGARWSARR